MLIWIDVDTEKRAVQCPRKGKTVDVETCEKRCAYGVEFLRGGGTTPISAVPSKVKCSYNPGKMEV